MTHFCFVYKASDLSSDRICTEQASSSGPCSLFHKELWTLYHLWSFCGRFTSNPSDQLDIEFFFFYKSHSMVMFSQFSEYQKITFRFVFFKGLWIQVRFWHFRAQNLKFFLKWMLEWSRTNFGWWSGNAKPFTLLWPVKISGKGLRPCCRSVSTHALQNISKH